MKNLKKEHRYLLLQEDIFGKELPSEIKPRGFYDCYLEGNLL